MDEKRRDLRGDGMGMPVFLLTVVSLVCLAMASGQAMPRAVDGTGAGPVDDRPAAAIGPDRPGVGRPFVVPIPDGARRGLPSDAHVLYFGAQPATSGSAAFAVVVFEQEAGSRRTLAVLEPTPDGTWRTAASNPDAVACARCGELLDDPFANGSVELTAGGFVLTQLHGGLHPSSARYAFERDDATGQWRVGSAEVEHSTLAESGEWARAVEPPAGARGMAFATFDPQWRVPEFWNAIVVDGATGLATSIFNKPNRASLDAAIGDACGTTPCRTLALQQSGCLAVAADDARQFHPARSLSDGGRATADQALASCRAAGGSGCRVIASGCSVDAD